MSVRHLDRVVVFGCLIHQWALRQGQRLPRCQRELHYQGFHRWNYHKYVP